MDDGVVVRGGGRVIGSVSKYDFEMQDMMFTREAHVLTDGLEGCGHYRDTIDGSLSIGSEASAQAARAKGTHTHTYRRDY